MTYQQKCKRWTTLSLPLSALALTLTACATPAPAPKAVVAPVTAAQQIQPELAAKVLKRKVAVGRFTNETRYGKALLSGDQLDPLGKQTSDMLSARLVQSGKFLVFERPDIAVVQKELWQQGKQGNLVGVDALIIGSLTEFGRTTEGESGFFSNTKKQVARAKVEIRLVDVTTGQAFFSASGSGEAAVENGTVMGFGDRAAYDQTLNDKAIGAAISDVMDRLVSKLSERPWHSDILKINGAQVFISGGERQGLRAGDRLSVMKQGDTVRSAQTGFDIALPPSRVAEVVVDSTFGDNESNEGSVTHITSGSIGSDDPKTLSIQETGR